MMMNPLFWLIAVFGFALGIVAGRLSNRSVSDKTSAATLTHTRSAACDTQTRWLALYALANGNRERAQFILEQWIDTAAPFHPDDWIMLLDIHHASGNRDQFDAWASRYAEQFGASVPGFTQWKQLHPDGSGLNRRHPKLLALLSGLPDREQQKRFLANLTLESTKPGRPAFTLSEAEELLKLRARLNPKPALDLNLTGSQAIPTGTWKSERGEPALTITPVASPPSLTTGGIIPPRSNLGRTGSQSIQVVVPQSHPPQDAPCALERQFKRIADKIAESWPSPACARYIDSLLVDSRGGRQGFPPEVISELFLLHALLEDHNPTRRDLWEQSPLR
ncbi:MAG: hypothetical protein WBC62_06250 [Candidatus Macondimonas sp.]